MQGRLGALLEPSRQNHFVSESDHHVETRTLCLLHPTEHDGYLVACAFARITDGCRVDEPGRGMCMGVWLIRAKLCEVLRLFFFCVPEIVANKSVFGRWSAAPRALPKQLGHGTHMQQSILCVSTCALIARVLWGSLSQGPLARAR